MATAQPVAQPSPSPCPECGTTRLLAEGVNTLRLMPLGAKLPGITSGWSEFWALVCPQCGHTTLYAKHPEKLQPKHHGG